LRNKDRDLHCGSGIGTRLLASAHLSMVCREHYTMRTGFDSKAAKRYVWTSTKLPWSGSTLSSIVAEVVTQVATGGTRMRVMVEEATEVRICIMVEEATQVRMCVMVGETIQMRRRRRRKSSEESRCRPSMIP
jgi:hypothetical protein